MYLHDITFKRLCIITEAQNVYIKIKYFIEALHACAFFYLMSCESVKYLYS
jgi:hypothetical protein